MVLPWKWFTSLSVFPASILSLCKAVHLPSRPKTIVLLYILDNEDEAPRCATLCCEGVATLGQLRAFLEKEPSPILWPFDFYNSKVKCRIAAEYEQSSPLELYDHVVTVIRSHGRQAMVDKRKYVEIKSMALMEPAAEEVIGSDHGREAMVKRRKTVELQSMVLVEPSTMEEVIPHVSSVSIAPVACDLISTPPHEEQDERRETSQPCEEHEDEHGETSCLHPKHTVFLSHSGVDKRFVGELCMDLEARNYYPFFDKRPDSLPKRRKFLSLIIEAAKQCLVAAVVLSEDYLSSKWPMIELAAFVRARKSGNKNLNLFPLFYKVTVADLDDMSIKYKWMPKWMEFAGVDQRVDLEEWAQAVRWLRRVNGLVFHEFENKESRYRDEIVHTIYRLTPPDMPYDTSKILGNTRICELAGVDQRLDFEKGAQAVRELRRVNGLAGVDHPTCHLQRRRRTINPFHRVSAPRIQEDPPSNPRKETKQFRGVRYREDHKRWTAEMKPPTYKKKEYFGEFKSQTQAARVVDVAFHYYGKPLNFSDTPHILATKPIPANINDKDKLNFVKEQAKWVSSIYSTLRFPPPSSGEVDGEGDDGTTQPQLSRHLEPTGGWGNNGLAEGSLARIAGVGGSVTNTFEAQQGLRDWSSSALPSTYSPTSSMRIIGDGDGAQHSSSINLRSPSEPSCALEDGEQVISGWMNAKRPRLTISSPQFAPPSYQLAVAESSWRACTSATPVSPATYFPCPSDGDADQAEHGMCEPQSSVQWDPMAGSTGPYRVGADGVDGVVTDTLQEQQALSVRNVENPLFSCSRSPLSSFGDITDGGHDPNTPAPTNYGSPLQLSSESLLMPRFFSVMSPPIIIPWTAQAPIELEMIETSGQ